MLPSYSASPMRHPAKNPRRHPRALCSIPLTLHHLVAGGVRSSRGISLDISESGLGALVQAKLEVGDTIGIELKLSDYDLNAVGIVRYTSSARSGFEFVGLAPEERQRIANLVGSA